MNRELKFRVWDMLTPIMMYFTFADLLKNSVNLHYGSCDWELMQFTGLKDKNGKEIYEGDILYDNKHLVVKILDGGAWALDYANGSGEKYLYPINKHLCVIGNIYENPELLKP